MAGFAYTAISIEGLETVGEIHAPDLDSAREQLRIRGLLAQTLRELPASGEDGLRTSFKKIKPRSMQVFSRQFATMIEAGLNIVASLVILEDQTDDTYLAEIIGELRADVEGGLLLSQAMARHPKVFNDLYVSMVQAGEASGMLDNVLDRVADQIEKETKLRRRVKGAMVYPTVVFTFATLVLIAMLMFIVPIFAKIFTELHGQLPFLTRIVLGASNLLRDRWYIVFPVIGFTIWGALRFKKS
jgi:type IV pilus assembly protein PilC